MPSPLAAMLRPKSLAVFGVSSKAETLSGKLLSNLFASGYTGAVYPINPKAEAIRGYKCYSSLKAIGFGVDLAIIMVPRDAVLTAIDECIEMGVKGIVVITAGFREGGDAGAEVERQVLAKVKAAGLRMIGPNCMGLINTESTVRMDASFSPAAALPGAVAFASHSGALGVAVLEAARDAGLGFSQFVSMGNSADVNVNDLLEFWEDDPGTKVILLYLEAVPEPERFLAITSRIVAKKPIIAYKGGRTAAGQKAASSHTGALAAGDTGVDALIKQAGILRADTLEEMFGLAMAFERAPLPQGPRVAVITNAGGPAIAATDSLNLNGLDLAELSPATQQALRTFLPAEASVGNPVDMLPPAGPDNFRQALELAAADPGVDALISITVTPIMVGPVQIAEGVTAANTLGKPVTSVYMTYSSFFKESRRIANLPPAFAYPEAAVQALGGLWRYAKARKAARPARVVEALVKSPILANARRDAQGYLGPGDTFDLIAEAGIPVAPWRIASDKAEVLKAASELGYPVVLKAFGETLVHKSELGAVVVGIGDEQQLTDALAAMQERLAKASAAPEGLLLQRQVFGGREVILGVMRDPSIGPLVMCGMGGVAVEVWKDVSFRVAPIDAFDADAMISELVGAKLLGAFRGKPAGDLSAFKKALVALSRLAAAHPEIAECDVNPLLVLDEGLGCVAVDARVRVEG